MWNAVSKWLATIANAAMSLVLVPFLLAKLGTEGYGLSALVGVIVSISAVADLGLQSALSRQLTAELARNDVRKFKELYASAMSIFVTIGLVCVACCVLFSPQIAGLFHVSPSLMHSAIVIISCYGSAAIFLSLVKPAYTAVLASYNRFDLFNHVEAGIILLRGVSLLAVLGFTSAGLYGWAGVNIACSSIEVLFVRRLTRKLRPDLVVVPRFIRLTAMASLFSLGGYFFIVKLIGMLGVHADPLILTSFLGPTAVALYRPPGLLAGLGRSVVMAMSWQLHPLATRYHVHGDQASLQKVLIRGTRYTLLIGIPVCVFLIVFAEPLTAFWLKKQLHDQYAISAGLLVLFAVAELCDYAGGSQGPILIGMNRMRFVVCLNLPLAVANLVGSILLVGYTSIGVAGVLVPTVTVFAIRRIVETIYTARVTHTPMWRYLRESYLRPLAVLATLFALTVFLRVTWSKPTLLRLAECGLVTTLGWAAVCWLVGLNDKDRRSFKEMLSKIRARIARSDGGRRAAVAVAVAQGAEQNPPQPAMEPMLTCGEDQEAEQEVAEAGR